MILEGIADEVDGLPTIENLSHQRCGEEAGNHSLAIEIARNDMANRDAHLGPSIECLFGLERVRCRSDDFDEKLGVNIEQASIDRPLPGLL